MKRLSTNELIVIIAALDDAIDYWGSADFAEMHPEKEIEIAARVVIARKLAADLRHAKREMQIKKGAATFRRKLGKKGK